MLSISFFLAGLTFSHPSWAQGCVPNPNATPVVGTAKPSFVANCPISASGLTKAFANTTTLNTPNTWTAGNGVAFVSLSPAPTVTADASKSNNFYLLFNQSPILLANPINLIDGQTLDFVFQQDATGSRLINFGSLFTFPGGTVPVLTSAANAIDRLACLYDAALNQLICRTLDSGTGASSGGTQTVQPLPNTDNAAALTKALANNAHVILSPGYYQVCSQVEVPRYKHLSAIGTANWQGGGAPGFAPPYPLLAEVVVGANGCSPLGGTFPAGTAFFHQHDQSVIEGFAIQGERQHSLNRNCINAVNAVSIEIAHMLFADCYVDIDRESNATPGDQGSLSQEAVIHDNTSYYLMFAGILCGPNGGSGCADERYYNNEFECVGCGNGGGQAWGIYCSQCSQFSFLGNRFEDGSGGILMTGGVNHGIANDNFFNRITPFQLLNASNVSIIGNKMSATEGCGLCTIGIEFGANPNTNLKIIGNQFIYNFQSVFKVDAGGSLNWSTFRDNQYAFTTQSNTALYADNHTMSQILANTPAMPTAAQGINNSFGVNGSGVGFEGTWTATGVTPAFFTAPGPTGDPMAMRLTETAVTNFHGVFNATNQWAVSTSATFTVFASFAPGSSGTRNAEIRVSDAGPGDVAYAIFNPTTCALVTSVTAGTGVIVGTPSAIPIGNGWCRGALSFKGFSPIYMEVDLASGSTINYAGDGTSNLLFYDMSTLYNGAVAPGMWGLLQ